ncbi:Epithelial splicing regulatory protein 1 [Elsinoe australis]|uniref:Epithelial splicing regulatory protein 1 n=1 Tax=Elsinoe australis TaxID=40998 RepID=A0A2P7YBV4_9PEZI|nr:Epithelial splicing regulatory protein 1 [Elsinoe australis]
MSSSTEPPTCGFCHQAIYGLTGAPFPTTNVASHATTPTPTPTPQRTGAFGHPGFTPQTPGPGRAFPAPSYPNSSASTHLQSPPVQHNSPGDSYIANQLQNPEPPSVYSHYQSPAVQRNDVFSPSPSGRRSRAQTLAVQRNDVCSPSNYDASPATSRSRGMTMGVRSAVSPPNYQVLGTVYEDPFSDSPERIDPGNGYTSPGADNPASLAAMIKSGGLEGGEGLPVSSPRPGQGRASRHSFGSVPSDRPVPIVRHWGAHMIDSVPDPPFMSSALRGDGGPPDLQAAIDYLPFTEPAKHMKSPEVGVVRVTNIPYASTKPEIIAAIGRNSRIVSQPAGSPFYAIHIVMDRSTGKTMDCYVEVEDKEEARHVVLNFKNRRDRGRAPKVGDRHVNVELSDIESLMRRLFPKANSIQWWGSIPVAYTPAEEYNSGFHGFVTTEECSQLVKHADNPGRSPFVNRSLSRAYESVVSMLWKYPWYKPDMVTVSQRALLFKTTCQMLKALMRFVSNNADPMQLSRTLLQELICAAVSVGFSHLQKNNIVDIIFRGGYGELVASVGYTPMTEHSSFWPFQVLDKKDGVRAEVVHYYASLFHQSTTIAVGAELTEQEVIDLSVNPFGGLKVEYPDDIRQMNLAQVAEVEWDTIIRALHRVFKAKAAPVESTNGQISFTPAPTPASARGNILIGLGASPVKMPALGAPTAPKGNNNGIPNAIGLGPGAIRPGSSAATIGVASPAPSEHGGFRSQANRFAAADMAERGVTGPGYNDEGQYLKSRWSSSTDSNGDLTSPTPAEKKPGAASVWYNKRLGFVGPSGVRPPPFPDFRNYPSDSPEKPTSAHSTPPRSVPSFNPAPGSHLRLGAASVPNSRTTYNHPNSTVDIDLAMINNRLMAPGLPPHIGGKTHNPPSPPQRSPLLQRVSEHFPSLGSMPLNAVLGRSKSKRATGSGPTSAPRSASPVKSTKSPDKKPAVPSKINLNPGATPFNSPAGDVPVGARDSGVGQGGVDIESQFKSEQNKGTTFAQIAARAGIKVGNNKAVKEQTKSKAKEGDQGWEP